MSRSHLVRQSLPTRHARPRRPDVWSMTLTMIAAAFGVSRGAPR